MSEDDKFVLSADEAISLLNDDVEYVHNYIQRGMMFFGCDFERDSAIEAFKAAELIELGGPSCKAMRHPIVVHEKDGRYSFFEADMAKVSALEAAREADPS